MAADQSRLVAVALAQSVVVAVAFQSALREVLATGAFGEAARIVVVFQVGLRHGVRRRLATMGRFHQQPGLFEVVITTADPAGAGRDAHGEALDHRLVGRHAVVLQIGGRLAEPGEAGLIIAEDQRMTCRAVLEVVVDTFFLAQTLNEVQVGFVVLHAILARWVDHRAELEAVGVGLDAVFLEHLGDDLRHAEVLEDALVGAVDEIGQLRHEREPVAGQALARFTLGDAVDQAVDAHAGGVEGEKGGLMQQCL